MPKQGLPLGTIVAVLIVAVIGVVGFDRALKWSDSERPIESLVEGAETIRGLEAAMGEGGSDEAAVAVGSRRNDPIHAPGEQDRTADQPTDTSPVMDLEHLTEADLRFLQETLDGDDPDARRSAARALVVSASPSATQLLFDAATRASEDMDLFCLAALDVARLQQKRDTLVALLLAMEHDPPVSSACRAEVEDRFALLGGRDLAAMAELQDDPEPKLRAWVVRLLADEEGEWVDDLLAQRVSDVDALVRDRAWSAWAGRSLDAQRARLEAAADAETDPEIAARARQVLAE